MRTADIDELLILVDNIERLLRAEAVSRERNQIGEIVAYIEKVSLDGSIAALANAVAIALSRRSLEGEFGVVAVVRALSALERLRASLLYMKAAPRLPREASVAV
ncbi:MAG TPA: hypothetical protein VG873_08910 [Burkholderiales bacterium]|nr:hypothetical protein [Burkholderiales bacterium]